MTSLENLVVMAKSKLDFNSKHLAAHILHNQDFARWSGSATDKHHHYGHGGLVQHTWEVVNLCFVTKKALNIKTIDDNELFLAALYHDIGKLYDYQFIDDKWQGTEHKRLIHHISRSAIMWSNVFEQMPNLNKELHDPVLHAILSHHGQREWGSPVVPKTQVAWLLHLCDGISARMDDWNKTDVVNKNK